MTTSPSPPGHRNHPPALEYPTITHPESIPHTASAATPTPSRFIMSGCFIIVVTMP